MYFWQPGKFDKSAYLNKYPDVKNARVDAARHYCDFGEREGRTAILTSGSKGRVNWDAYRNLNNDLGNDSNYNNNPRKHFCDHGWNEDRMMEVTSNFSQKPACCTSKKADGQKCTPSKDECVGTCKDQVPTWRYAAITNPPLLIINVKVRQHHQVVRVVFNKIITGLSQTI